MDWLPNEDAMFYFVDEILPLIRREAPEVTLSIIGRSPSRKLKALATRHPEIKLTGQVEDVRPFLAQGAVNIVPIRVGGGTRLKIFEAMSMGKAIVSTTVGAEGLPVNHGEHLLVADNAANFAESTVRLLRNPVERAKLGNAARSLVESKYSWAAVAEDFVTVLKDVIKRDGEGAKDVSSAPYVG